MGFCNYFLVVWDFVKYAKEHDIYIGPGRGSAAGSLVSYCLNITTIDPIKYNLLFERFLNPERVTMPDIDIDMQDNKRDEIINYCINKYGTKRVVPIIAFGTLASKQVIRDVGRTMDIDLKIIDYICKNLDSRLSLKDNLRNNKKLHDYIMLDESGTIIKPDYITYAFRKLLIDNNMRMIRFHDLRHTCASLLLNNGKGNITMKDIQEWLGHSDYKTTANIYAHLDLSSKFSSLKTLDSIIEI